MKYKTTAKALREYGYNVKSAGYCDLQYLLNNHSATAYTCGVYGWNFDVFDFGGVCLITGYRTRGADVRLSMEFCERWDKRAKNATYDERKRILAEFEREIKRIAKEFVESKRG